MKKVFSTFIAVLGFSFLMAQTAEVPTSVKIAFKDAYKSTTAEWTSNQQYYMASWQDNNQHKTAYYAKSDQVTLVRVEKDVQLADLTQAAQDNINRFTTNGSQYTLTRTFKVENFEGVAEGCELNNGQGTILLFFDAVGNLVKREIK